MRCKDAGTGAGTSHASGIFSFRIIREPREIPAAAKNRFRRCGSPAKPKTHNLIITLLRERGPCDIIKYYGGPFSAGGKGISQREKPHVPVHAPSVTERGMQGDCPAMRGWRQPRIVLPVLPVILYRMRINGLKPLAPKSADRAKLVRNWCGRAGRKPGNPRKLRRCENI